MSRKCCQTFVSLLCALAPFVGVVPAIHAQPCALSISPPNDTASLAIEGYPAWWYSNDYSAADNPAFLLTTVFANTAGLSNIAYLGWCVDTTDSLNGYSNNYTTTLYSTCDPNIQTDLPTGYDPGVYASPAIWKEVNYLLNNQNDAYFYDVQVAIWELLGETINPDLLAGPSGPDEYPYVYPTEVASLVLSAQTKAALWTPSCGDVIAVLVSVDVPAGTAPDQMTIIDVPYTVAYLTNVPTGGYVGCNPTNNLPTDDTVVTGVTMITCCGQSSVTATHVDSGTPCSMTRTFTITGQDSCGNTVSSNAVYTWTADTTGPQFTSVPQNQDFGCNPKSGIVPTLTKTSVTATDNCGGTPSITVNYRQFGGASCTVTGIYTFTATDACGNQTCVPVTYTWTVDTSTPTITGLQDTDLGCNANVPTTVQYSVNDTCGNVTSSQSYKDSVNNCIHTRVFTVTATDTCSGNTGTATATYTWTVNTTPPTINNLPTGGYVGCNSSLAPTTNSFTNVTATGQCGAATLTITVGKDTNSGCVGSRTFTFTAVDGCSNTTVKTVEYTWTAGGQIEVMCPSNVTIVTNMCQMYCTFAPCDWGCACVGCNNNNNNWWGNNWGNCNWGNNNNWGWGNWNQNNNNNCWWQNWCSSNTASQCWPTWTNWWNGCGSASQCSNLWKSVGSSQTNCWAGCWNNNQSGNWWTAWNCGNQGNQWVPCNGNNPGDVLTNCFRSIYTNGTVCVGLPNSGHCYTFTSPNCIQTCLNWGGNCAPLTCSATNPATCSSGAFCAQVLALRLNCDFGDSGCSGLAGRCGDLVLNCPSSPCNGKKVRDILGCCNTALGGGSCPAGCSVQYLCGLCSNLNNCFRGCQPSGWCTSNLTSVYIPPVSQTGVATVLGSCTPNPTLTNYDTIVSAGCTGNYVIEREWVATDACGNSNTCTQLITIGQTNSSSISGVVVLACAGDTNLSNNEGLSGVTVTLKEGSTVIATTTTDTNGNYDFSDVALGDYTVVVTPLAGLSETYPATSGNSAAVNLTACQNGVANFAYIGTTPGVQFIKSAPCTIPCSGIITYSFAVTNTGNTCETLKVVDPLLGGTIFTQTGVAPGQGFLFTSNYNAKSTACMVTNTAQGIGTAPNGKSVTNTSTVVTCVTTKCITNSVCCSFNSQNPGGGNLWCNAHLSCTPGKACTVYCQNASVTLTCNDGKTYTFPVPDCQVNFSSSCSSGSCSYNGSSWQTTLPCKGDSQCFLSGCGIPWQSDFANCRSACWTGTFSCSTPGVACSWQWSCANYNCDLSNCGNINVKPCYQTSCGYNNSDCAGTPENCKSSCQGGGCGNGGNNYCGSWSNSGSFTCN